MTLPKIPDGKDWSEPTWRAGLDEAVRRNTERHYDSWDAYCHLADENTFVSQVTIAHATTLLDAGIVKPVVSEAEELLAELDEAARFVNGRDMALKAIQSALDKARDGQ